MNLLKKTPILAGIALWGLLVVGSVFANESQGSILIRVAAYNVEFGKNATPEEIGKMFKPYNFDIIGFNEVPDGDWTARVGKVVGMKHSYVGKISSANHRDKIQVHPQSDPTARERSSMNSLFSVSVHGTRHP